LPISGGGNFFYKHKLENKMKLKEAKQIIESEFGDLKKEDRSQYDTLVFLLVKYGADDSHPLGGRVRGVACGQWISVEDKLPENKQPILVWQKNNDRAFYAEYDGDKKRFVNPAGSADGIHLALSYYVNITHWMKLPSKPSA
jgi:hypothetical protein